MVGLFSSSDRKFTSLSLALTADIKAGVVKLSHTKSKASKLKRKIYYLIYFVIRNQQTVVLILFNLIPYIYSLFSPLKLP